MTEVQKRMIRGGGVAVATEAVELIVGEAGISFSGGELVVWKRNVVRAGGRRLVEAGNPAVNAATFTAWLAACPQALGIDAKGQLRLPRLEDGTGEDALAVLTRVLATASAEFGRQIWRAALGALLVGVTSLTILGLIVVANVARPQDGRGFKMGLLALAGAVGALLLAARAVRLWEQRFRVRKAMRAILELGEIDVAALAQLTDASASTLPKLLAIVALCFAMCPFVGLLTGMMAMAASWNRRGWTHAVSMVAVIVGGASSIIAVLVMVVAL